MVKNGAKKLYNPFKAKHMKLIRTMACMPDMSHTKIARELNADRVTLKNVMRVMGIDIQHPCERAQMAERKRNEREVIQFLAAKRKLVELETLIVKELVELSNA